MLNVLAPIGINAFFFEKTALKHNVQMLLEPLLSKKNDDFQNDDVLDNVPGLTDQVCYQHNQTLYAQREPAYKRKNT